jgi:hypothetical protein
MITDKNRIFDGFQSLEGGVDAGRIPSSINPNQCESAENMVFRGGDAATRPGWRKLTESFTNPAHCYDVNGYDTNQHVPGQEADTIYRNGTMQCVASYSPHHSGEDCLMAMIGGRLFKIVPGIETAKVTEITPITDENSPFHTLIPFPPPPDPPAPGGTYPIPRNDTFPGQSISGKTNISGIEGTCLGATRETGEPTGDNTVWYKWRGITTGERQFFFVNQPGYIVEVYTGTAVNALTQIASRTMPNQVSFTQTAGTDYHIRVRPGTQPLNDFKIRWNNITEVGPPEDKVEAYRNLSEVPIAYMLQADKWLIIQDGSSRPILYDGHRAVRSDNDNPDREKTQVPVGTIMGYGMGRVIVIVNDRDVAFGDIYGSHPFPDPADSLIMFTERNFLAEGEDAAIPFNFGIATGMEFFPQLDTSTGNGQLMVFAEKGASSFILSLPRELWKTSQFQIVALRATSLRGHRAIDIANEDLWFRAADGFRSYRQARSESTGWAHIPQSTNVKNILRYDDVDMLKFGSVIYFNNRIIGTCLPAFNQSRPYHEGAVVVDFEIISSFGQNSLPAWDGNWTLGPRKGINLPNKITQLVTGEFNGVTRAFAFGLEVNRVEHGEDYELTYTNQLYELSMDDKNDWDNQHIEWELVTRAFGFSQQSTPFNENELYDGDLWLKGITE